MCWSGVKKSLVNIEVVAQNDLARVVFAHFLEHGFLRRPPEQHMVQNQQLRLRAAGDAAQLIGGGVIVTVIFLPKRIATRKSGVGIHLMNQDIGVLCVLFYCRVRRYVARNHDYAVRRGKSKTEGILPGAVARAKRLHFDVVICVDEAFIKRMSIDFPAVLFGGFKALGAKPAIATSKVRNRILVFIAAV
jgi:hypothetical protein